MFCPKQDVSQTSDVRQLNVRQMSDECQIGYTNGPNYNPFTPAAG